LGNKEHGLYVSSTPSSAAKKAVTKLCTANKSKKVEFSIREITQGSKKKTYGPYEGYIEKLTEPIELMGRVIRYKPVAKLSGKSAAKKGGMFRNPAAGPAPEPKEGPAPENSNNNSPWGKNEQIAFINLNTPDDRIENTDDYDEKIKQLKELDNDIFNIQINDQSRNNWHGTPEKTNIFITFNNLSIAKKKRNFKKNLDALIEILKFFKKQAADNAFNTEFMLFNPNEEHFSPEHNEFLKILAYKIDPTAPTVNQNLRHVPAPPGSAPP